MTSTGRTDLGTASARCRSTPEPPWMRTTATACAPTWTRCARSSARRTPRLSCGADTSPGSTHPDGGALRFLDGGGRARPRCGLGGPALL